MPPSCVDARLRAFGRAEDLDLAFARTDRPALVTDLLAACADQDRAYWWSMPVGLRIATLLRLLALSDGTDRLGVQLQCAQAGCGERFEIELPLPELIARAVGTAMHVEWPDGRHATLRLPTGDDLRAWQAMAQPDAATMIEALRVDGDVAPGHAALLAEAMAAHDPLVAFSVSCACPACGVEDDLPVDLEGLALERFAQRQQGLLRDVHALASRYGWTEHEVLAVPAHRRAQYIALIEDALP